jgi:hypothetical protein
MPPDRALARGELSRVPLEVGEAKFAVIRCNLISEVNGKGEKYRICRVSGEPQQRRISELISNYL